MKAAECTRLTMPRPGSVPDAAGPGGRHRPIMPDAAGRVGAVRLVVVLDCVDADALADFWSSALGFRRGPFGAPHVRLTDPARRWPDLLLQQVPEPRTGKNRMHLDLQVREGNGVSTTAGAQPPAGSR